MINMINDYSGVILFFTLVNNRKSIVAPREKAIPINVTRVPKNG